ncbi:unnamed protein product [Microthlaspi erraticum]|uniref:FBD domain-containing protein n=1 Tax=Microthlaspi erraticum TaxID=1685480 RepID=A0A6D2IS18_9BRAS|nr:unnamed protein product [Microthlaspi erraticum]
MILSGCPILEFLKLDYCDDDLRVLDLRNSLRLRTLEVIRPFFSGHPSQVQIVAPHVRCLKLENSLSLCTLVDLSSLAEAKLYNSSHRLQSNIHDPLGVTVQKMAEMFEKLKNVEKLTFGSNFLKNLSLPELRSVPFPMFKIKALTLETLFAEDGYVIPAAIEKLLQHSPDLKKLTLNTRTPNTNPILWRKSRWEAELKHMATSIELLVLSFKYDTEFNLRYKSGMAYYCVFDIPLYSVFFTK